jgi:hypothetical protein
MEGLYDYYKVGTCFEYCRKQQIVDGYLLFWKKMKTQQINSFNLKIFKILKLRMLLHKGFDCLWYIDIFYHWLAPF